MTFRNKHMKVSDSGSSIRTGLSNASYEAQNRTPTFKSQGEVPESELPQTNIGLGPSFEESEAWYMPPSGINWGFDSPILSDPQGPWDIVFQAWTNDCLKIGDTARIYLQSSYPITGVTVKEPLGATISKPVRKGKPSARNGIYDVTLNDNPRGFAVLDVAMITPNNELGIPAGVTGVSRAVAYECEDACVPDAAMAWDDATSADTVARSASVTVAVTGNNGPFTWSVAGTGFTLDSATTGGLSNTLNADATACGLATITVTGCDGTVKTGYVRCTEGVWGAWTWNAQSAAGCGGVPSPGHPTAWSDECAGLSNKYQYQVRHTSSLPDPDPLYVKCSGACSPTCGPANCCISVTSTDGVCDRNYVAAANSAGYISWEIQRREWLCS